MIKNYTKLILTKIYSNLWADLIWCIICIKSNKRCKYTRSISVDSVRKSHMDNTCFHIAIETVRDIWLVRARSGSIITTSIDGLMSHFQHVTEYGARYQMNSPMDLWWVRVLSKVDTDGHLKHYYPLLLLYIYIPQWFKICSLPLSPFRLYFYGSVTP